jgi:hypothetical protein
MASPGEASRSDTKLTDGCTLDLLVPERSGLSLEETLSRGEDRSTASQLKDVVQRKLLFFGEYLALSLDPC